MQRINSIILLLLLGLLTACADASPLSMGPEPTATPLPHLNIFSQEDTLPRSLLSDFERQFAVKVNYATSAEHPTGLADIQAGLASYDLVVLSDTLVGSLRAAGLFAPLNQENIPNFKNLDPSAINPLYDPGNRYCIPFQGGTWGLGYHRQAAGQAMHGWADFFEAERPLRLGLPDDSRLSLAAALLYLGYSPNTSNNFEIVEAQQLWQKQAGRIIVYTPTTAPVLLAQGQVELVLARSGPILQLSQTNPAINYVIPTEGSLMWVDNLCLLANSPYPELAETLINYLLEAPVSAALAQAARTGSLNQAALPLLSQADRHNPALYPDNELRQRLFTLVNVDPLSNQRFEQAWANLVADPDFQIPDPSN